jgi:hypothetical protein
MVLEDLADDRCGFEAGELREITTGFGVAGAHQHAAVLRHQREDVAGLDDVRGLSVLCYGSQHRA